MFNRSLYNFHKSAVIERNLGKDFETVQLFTMAQTLDEAREVMIKGLNAVVSNDSVPSGGVVLFSDPIVAANVCRSAIEDETDYCRVFIFRLVLGRYMTLKGKSPTSSEDALSWLERIPRDCAMVKIEYGAEPESDNPSGFFIVVRPEAAFLAYPEIYMVLEEDKVSHSRSNQSSKNSRELIESIITKDLSLDTLLQEILSESGQTQAFSSDDLSSLTKEDKQMLESIENKMEQHLKHFEDCILFEMDPITAESISKTESKALDYQIQLGEIRAQIDQEKAKQEQILRDFRSGSSSTNPPRRKKHSL
uniref:Uncharacterized protein n=1 Tax=Aplanochytrium stocchinoi TaxID=215587 RepID=A0A7S3PCB7_9STRA